jgi:outer membrane protein OmpA-like peptidoglycan-associated protein
MHTYQKGLLAAIGIAALQACSTTVPIENAQLTAAQAAFTSAQATPDTPVLASAELREAEVALERARAAWAAQENHAAVDHLSYMAIKKTAIAQELAFQRMAEKAINDARAQRQQTLLVARTLEAESAQRMAVSAQRDAQVAQQAAAVVTRLAEADATALRSRLSEMDAKQTDRGMVVTLGDLLFDNNSDVLKPGAGQSLLRLGAFLKAYPTRTALVEGYTDSVGSTNSNQTLSEQRAASVRSALLGLGVGGERLVIRGYGEAYPVGNNQSGAGRLSNRRVEVILSDDSGQIPPR